MKPKAAITKPQTLMSEDKPTTPSDNQSDVKASTLESEVRLMFCTDRFLLPITQETQNNTKQHKTIPKQSDIFSHLTPTPLHLHNNETKRRNTHNNLFHRLLFHYTLDTQGHLPPPSEIKCNLKVHQQAQQDAAQICFVSPQSHPPKPAAAAYSCAFPLG